MSATKKPRADSKLKTLPEERQAEIFEYAGDHSLIETVKWLRDGPSGLAPLVTSKSAVGEFLSWRSLKLQFREDETTTETLLEQLKAEVPEMTEAQLDELGQRTFSLLSIRRQDLDGFVQVRSARAKGELEKAKLQLRERAESRLGEALGLQRQKFQRDTCELFLQWSEDQRAKEIASKAGATNAEKIEALGQLMFGDSWAPPGAGIAPGGPGAGTGNQ